ncbi:SpoIIE family protein phosphatase [Paenarthrobacter sp. DKR-5]|uniref:PP2C family protein-serine/threonine phosphatase n=1 Tax=Paenarthrobacter sp. DKR-5 TaxID=2835535 RepID=UPI001BDC36C3|nr:SpoIIE family protein phosphatase [Paenarthrobacter sp. DKR-5]MBT1004348.1 SpoIIE family protein phosphatase [Paenarthrobacter sp. DKR-5]
MPDKPIRRAVVIEDDPDIRGLLVKILSLQGFEVAEAGNGEAGLEAVRSSGADLVTLDLNLPDHDGVDVCRQLRLFSDAYVIMITARADEIDRLIGLETGADDYVSKPFSPREIQARINALFRRPRAAPAPAPAVDGDLERAAEVQRSLLPREAPQLAGYEIAGRMQPSRSVGGDFFDWYPTPEGVQLTVADAMGKGMGAALIAATVRAVMRSAGKRPDVESAFRSAGRTLEADLEHSESFVTLFHARLDAVSGAVSYVDAGHGLAFHVAAGGAVRRLASSGPPVGAWPDHEWSAAGVQLDDGDALAVVSDGVLDVYDTVEELVEALGAAVAGSTGAEEACDAILRLVAPAEVSDDVTVVVLRRPAEVSALLPG